nr:unnamed protein product [Digitaria exilis]
MAAMAASFLLCALQVPASPEPSRAEGGCVKVDVSVARNIPETLFGVFFEEINHAGSGGLWMELVSNRGFEAGAFHTPSNIDPWSIIGDNSSIAVATDDKSCFSRNIAALRMEVLCNDCPAGGVGIYNPGFWGMEVALLKATGQKMLSDGRKQLAHGKRGLGTMETFGITGLMMALAFMSFSNLLKTWALSQSGSSMLVEFCISHSDAVNSSMVEPFIKAFVSEYAVKDEKDPGNATLFAALAEAAFLIALENNSDVVEMASYAPLLVNNNDRSWLPDAIVFNSWQQYGTPSYWMQMLFRESSGAVLHPIVNFGSRAINLTIRATGLEAGVSATGSRITVLTSSDVMDGNSFNNPNNVVPVTRELPSAGEEMQAFLSPYSFTSFDLALEQ